MMIEIQPPTTAVHPHLTREYFLSVKVVRGIPLQLHLDYDVTLSCRGTGHDVPVRFGLSSFLPALTTLSPFDAPFGPTCPIGYTQSSVRNPYHHHIVR